MDITPLFRASIKTIRTRQKALGLSGTAPDDPNRLLNRTRHPTDAKFHVKAKEVLNSITKLKDFLFENRRSYLDTGSQLFSLGPKLSDSEIQEIDVAAQLIIKNCSQLLQELKKEQVKAAGNLQTIEHRQNVLAILDDYLKIVCKVFSDQKAARSKRKQDLQNLAKLDTSFPNSTRKAVSENSARPEETTGEGVRQRLSFDDDAEKEDGEIQLTSEELQLFEKENVQLFNELNSLNEEVKVIQSKVVKIAELQQTFTEKVLEQEKDIDRIATTTVGATENIREGNEQLRQAMQNNSGFRVAIIFFLLVLSFSLLFLDWYNE